MAGSGRILRGIKWRLCQQYQKRYSKEQIEEFLGITIKKVMKGKDEKYNVYKDGKLVLAQIASWEISELLINISENLSTQLEKQAELEDDEGAKKSAQMAKEIEEQEIRDDEENFRTCPICGTHYLIGTHFH
ncbi:MAG: hypothetical protein HFJ28_04625 [Clostridia bacterium]|jgi:uncharacterized protein with PIN domain|nr:hypothetical protein [Clostridia bacterium]